MGKAKMFEKMGMAEKGKQKKEQEMAKPDCFFVCGMVVQKRVGTGERGACWRRETFCPTIIADEEEGWMEWTDGGWRRTD